MTLQTIAAAILLALGAVLILLASVGVVRMPDLFTRMHAATKASSLGALLLLGGVALYFDRFAVTSRAVAIVIFLFLTLPVAAHLLGRAAYRAGVPLWAGTVRDELRDHAAAWARDDEAGP